MSVLKITLYPVDFETPFSLGDCVMSIALLSNEMGLGYELNPSGAAVEGARTALLEFLEQLKHEALGKLADKVVLVVNFTNKDELTLEIPETDTSYAGAITRRNRSLEEMVLDMIG